GVLEVLFDNGLRDFEIDDETANFHRLGSYASSIAISEACPTKRLVHSVFECMSLFQVFGGAHALDRVLDQQYGMIIDVDRLEAFGKWPGKYLFQVRLFAEFLTS